MINNSRILLVLTVLQRFDRAARQVPVEGQRLLFRAQDREGGVDEGSQLVHRQAVDVAASAHAHIPTTARLVADKRPSARTRSLTAPRLVHRLAPSPPTPLLGTEGHVPGSTDRQVSTYMYIATPSILDISSVTLVYNESISKLL